MGEIKLTPLSPSTNDGSQFAPRPAELQIGMTAESASCPGKTRLAIRPYPEELEEWWSFNNGRKVLLRPIKPDDESAHHEFFKKLDPVDIRFRFFLSVKDFDHEQLARYTKIDYEREMAFIATAMEDGMPETLGVVRAVNDAGNIAADCSIIVRSDLKRQGLGYQLMDKIIRYAKGRGLKTLVAEILSGNKPSLKLAQKFGFESYSPPYGGIVNVRLEL